MRLAQAVRKFGKTQSQIIDFLAQKDELVTPHGNTKLSESQINHLETAFGAPEPIQDLQEETELTPDIEGPLETESPTKGIEPSHLQETTENDEPDPQDEEEPVEVIRVKKVKLQGIKVVGKIDLPEPPVKKPKEESKEDQPNRKTQGRKLNPKRKPRKKLSFEEKQQRLQQEAEKRKARRKRELKEKKKRHYFEKVHPKTAKEKRKEDNLTEDLNSAPVRTVQRPKAPKYKNPLRRFWAWLNGEYDNF